MGMVQGSEDSLPGNSRPYLVDDLTFDPHHYLWYLGRRKWEVKGIFGRKCQHFPQEF